jgi:hypothetical protein
MAKAFIKQNSTETETLIMGGFNMQLSVQDGASDQK